MEGRTISIHTLSQRMIRHRSSALGRDATGGAQRASLAKGALYYKAHLASAAKRPKAGSSRFMTAQRCVHAPIPGQAKRAPPGSVHFRAKELSFRMQLVRRGFLASGSRLVEYGLLLGRNFPYRLLTVRLGRGLLHDPPTKAAGLPPPSFSAAGYGTPEWKEKMRRIVDHIEDSCAFYRAQKRPPKRRPWWLMPPVQD